jgi:hypothetical protein
MLNAAYGMLAMLPVVGRPGTGWCRDDRKLGRPDRRTIQPHNKSRRTGMTLGQWQTCNDGQAITCQTGAKTL